MTDVVVDTNVPVVANNRDGDYASSCVLRCIERLRGVRKNARVTLDFAGKILGEYNTYLKSAGQPGPGDAFYFHLLQHLGDDTRTHLVELECHGDRVYELFPDDARLAEFDRSDRKFAAAAIAAGGKVLNAIDSDWLDHRTALKENGVDVEFVCGLAAATKSHDV